MLLTKIFNNFFPRHCVLCDTITYLDLDLCLDCDKTLPRIQQACYQCAMPTAGNICGACLQNPPPYDRLISVCYYEQPMVYCVQQLKFQHRLFMANVLGQLLLQKLISFYDSRNNDHFQSLPDIIIPVPLHISRIRQRGFNQAIEIAKPISKFFKCQSI